MVSKAINIEVVSEVAIALKELKEHMVFVGGAIISLYADDPAADEIRPTGDVDIAIKLMNYGKWSKMQERLAELGFYPDPEGHAICSYLYKNIPVDIMPSEDGPLGPANKWYKKGFEDLWRVKAKEEEIQILSTPAYLAAKFEAFHGRGVDYRTSHDFEDIIYVLDNRISVVEEIKKSHPEIKDYIIDKFKQIIQNPAMAEIFSAHLHPLMIDERYPLLIEKINQIVNL